MASSSVGSSTFTGWNRLSKAASFSIYFRYSTMVVAPIICSSPLAKEGLRILEASIAPSAPPAPIRVCSSSMNRMTFPSSITSRMTRLMRSSNSPRYLLPATMPERSRVKSRLPRTVAGTFPSTMRWARPSTTAVLPTPGSPIRQGLFLLRRLRIWISRRISSSLPMTGSSIPSLARSVRSLLYWSRVEGRPLPDMRLPKSSL